MSPAHSASVRTSVSWFVAAHRAMADEDFAFGLGYEEDAPWSAYIDRLDSHRRAIVCLPNTFPRRSSWPT